MASKMQKNIKFNSLQQVSEYASNNNSVLVVYDDYVLDVTSFANHHPGGSGLILHYKNTDITSKMGEHHSLSLVMADSMVIGTFEKQIRRMINPDQALMPQVWNIDHQSYLKMIDSPHWLFVDSPRMFQMDFFQMFSHNKWYHIFILPILILINYGLQINWTGFQISKAIPILVLGILSFSLAEYLIHRFIFHSERYLFDNRLVRYLHFVIHGIHHMLPIDPDRIVYPPALFFFTVLLGYFTVYQFIGFSNPQHNIFFWAGFGIGYLIYDLCHYSLHHIDTSKNKETSFHKLQRYHNQHHFGGEDKGFGVSSPFWDFVFRTQMTKKDKHK